MTEDVNSAPLFYVWSSKKTTEGPFELPALVTRIKSGQVGPKTWLYSDAETTWRVADSIPELGFLFKRTPQKPAGSAVGKVDHKLLRTIKIFAHMPEDGLEVFARHSETLSVPQFSMVVKKGDHGDAMFSVVEGELRARSLVDGKESTLATMGPGDSFGEVSLLDHGPRSADVLANKNSVVLKLSSAALEKIMKDEPAAAAPFLAGLGRSAVARLRAITKRYEDSIHFSRTAGVHEHGAED